jgi:hypothetical protein
MNNECFVCLEVLHPEKAVRLDFECECDHGMCHNCCCFLIANTQVSTFYQGVICPSCRSHYIPIRNFREAAAVESKLIEFVAMRANVLNEYGFSDAILNNNLSNEKFLSILKRCDFYLENHNYPSNLNNKELSVAKYRLDIAKRSLALKMKSDNIPLGPLDSLIFNRINVSQPWFRNFDELIEAERQSLQSYCSGNSLITPYHIIVHGLGYLCPYCPYSFVQLYPNICSWKTHLTDAHSNYRLPENVSLAMGLKQCFNCAIFIQKSAKICSTCKEKRRHEQTENNISIYTKLTHGELGAFDHIEDNHHFINYRVITDYIIIPKHASRWNQTIPLTYLHSGGRVRGKLLPINNLKDEIEPMAVEFIFDDWTVSVDQYDYGNDTFKADYENEYLTLEGNESSHIDRGIFLICDSLIPMTRATRTTYYRLGNLPNPNYASPYKVVHDYATVVIKLLSKINSSTVKSNEKKAKCQIEFKNFVNFIDPTEVDILCDHLEHMNDILLSYFNKKCKLIESFGVYKMEKTKERLFSRYQFILNHVDSLISPLSIERFKQKKRRVTFDLETNTSSSTSSSILLSSNLHEPETRTDY